MKRQQLSKKAAGLCKVAELLTDSGSRLEDHFLERQLEQMVDAQLQSGGDSGFDEALDFLALHHKGAYHELLDALEARRNHPHWRRTFFDRGPILAWSRFAIPAGTIKSSVIDALRQTTAEHLLLPSTEILLADQLYSPDQVPIAYGEVAALTQKMARSLYGGEGKLAVSVDTMPVTKRACRTSATSWG